MVDVNPTIYIITFNVKVKSFQQKQSLSEWMKNKT